MTRYLPIGRTVPPNALHETNGPPRIAINSDGLRGKFIVPGNRDRSERLNTDGHAESTPLM